MIQDEFEHYVRLIVREPLESVIARRFLLTTIASLDEDNGINADEDDTVMIYHVEGNHKHCYDIPLERDISELEGDRLARALEAELEMDWDLESTMDVPDKK